MKKVLVGGVFDILHGGHEFFLRKAKENGDYLVVVVASDKTAAEKRPPVHIQMERMENLKKLGIADEVVAGGEGNFMTIVEQTKPDVVVFGHDQDSLLERLRLELEEREIKIVKLEDIFEREMYSTTKLLEK